MRTDGVAGSAALAAIIVCCLLSAGCITEEEGGGGIPMKVSENEIRRVATAELLRTRRVPEHYRTIVSPTEKGWRVEFDPIEPSPPGSEFVVFLGRDGTITGVFQGE